MTGAESRLINLSDGGGDPSTQPFQPLRVATRFLRGFCSSNSGGEPIEWSNSETPSSGVWGLLDDVRDVVDAIEGPGVGGL